MYLRAVLLGPPRVFCFLLLLILMRIICAVVQCAPRLRPWLLPSGASFVSRAILLVLGFLSVQHKRILQDPDAPDAPTATRSRQSIPVVVSNHVSWADILLVGYLYRCTPNSYITPDEFSCQVYTNYSEILTLQHAKLCNFRFCVDTATAKVTWNSCTRVRTHSCMQPWIRDKGRDQKDSASGRYLRSAALHICRQGEVATTRRGPRRGVPEHSRPHRRTRPKQVGSPRAEGHWPPRHLR